MRAAAQTPARVIAASRTPILLNSPGGGVAAGVRRLEALTGKAARQAGNKQLQAAKAASAELKVSVEDMPGRIAALMDERNKLERELSEARKKLAELLKAAGVERGWP